GELPEPHERHLRARPRLENLDFHLPHPRLREHELRRGAHLLLDAAAHRIDELLMLEHALVEDLDPPPQRLQLDVGFRRAEREIEIDLIEGRERRFVAPLGLTNRRGDSAARPQRLLDGQCGRGPVAALAVRRALDGDARPPRPPRSAEVDTRGLDLRASRLRARVRRDDLPNETDQLDLLADLLAVDRGHEAPPQSDGQNRYRERLKIAHGFLEPSGERPEGAGSSRFIVVRMRTGDPP